MRSKFHVSGSVVLIIFVLLFLTGQVLAAAETGEYLKYQEPQPTASSWLATSSYIISLLLTFLLVLGLAYFTSKFLGQRMTRAGGFGGKVYSTLSLGPNRAVHVVEIAGKFMVLGVTEQNITLLNEITSATEIERIKALQSTANALPPEQFGSIFRRQLVSLKQMPRNFPLVFGSDTPETVDKEPENNNRKR